MDKKSRSSDTCYMGKRGGITLIELMLLVALVGILTKCAISAYRDEAARGFDANGPAIEMERSEDG